MYRKRARGLTLASGRKSPRDSKGSSDKGPRGPVGTRGSEQTGRPATTGSPPRTRRVSRTGASNSAGGSVGGSGSRVSAGSDGLAPQALLAIYRPDLSRLLGTAGVPSFRHAQVLEHLLRRPERRFAEASVLPTDLRSRLDDHGASVLSLVATRTAVDGTTKLLLEASDGSRIETVLMSYGKRATVCLSSQVGCPVGCVFCATGAMGFCRNLSTAEIVDQLRAAASVATAAGRRVTNLVYMGMGEPLLNLGAVIDSLRVITARAGLGLGRRAISVSTVGIPGGMVRLARTEPQINLALSLHAADDATRALIIPEGFRHPLREVLEAAWEHFAITGRKLLVEYVLISGLNDSLDDARRLAAFLRGHVVTVNLLAWNPISPDEVEPLAPEGRKGARLRGSTRPTKHSRPCTPSPSASRHDRSLLPSPPTAIAAFRGALRTAHIEAVVRQSKGSGIEAACGQLAGMLRSYRDDEPFFEEITTTT
jgi:23S rRNA (adenine2503-C2)-methyltransferase